MALLQAPFLSFIGTGKFAKTFVVQRLRARGVAREYVVTTNVNTSKQQASRQLMTWCSTYWKRGSNELHNVYIRIQKPKGPNARALCIKYAKISLQGQTTLARLLVVPNVNALPLPLVATINPGNGSMSGSMFGPSLPSGWSAHAWQAIALTEQDPHHAFIGPMARGGGLLPAANWGVSGLTHGVLWRAWVFWTVYDPHGQLHSSLAWTGTATPT